MSFHPGGGVGVDPGYMPPPGPGIPPPPQGPGAAPPFAAPPTERDKRRLWISLGIGAVILLLCCAGVGGGVGIVVVNGLEQARRQATATVDAFLQAVQDGDRQGAALEICDDLEAGTTVGELIGRADAIRFSDYTLGEAEIANTIDVPVTLRTANGEIEQLYQVGSEGARSCIFDILAQ